MDWAAKEKVDLSIDFITSNGDKILLTIAAEAQAKARARHPVDPVLVRPPARPTT